MACCTPLVTTFGMPRPRSPPPGLGIQTRRMSPGRKRPASKSRRRSASRRGACASASSTVWPSTPGAPLLRTTFSSARARFASDATSSSSRSGSAARCGARCCRADAAGGRPGGRTCRGFALRCVQQPRAMLGSVRASPVVAPLRAVGEHEAQLTVSRPSQPISPFARPAFTGVIAPTKRSDFCRDIVPSSCLLQVYRSRGPLQTSLGKNTGCPAAPAPITAPASVGFWASRS